PVRDLRFGDGAGEPGRRHPVLVHRSEGAQDMSTDSAAATVRSARALRMRRWRQSAATIWKDFKTQRSGVAGLIGLSIFILIAIITPIVIAEESLSVTQATGGRMVAPDSEYW